MVKQIPVFGHGAVAAKPTLRNPCKEACTLEFFWSGVALVLASFVVPVWLLWPVGPAGTAIGIITAFALLATTIALAVRASRIRFGSANDWRVARKI